MSAELLDVNVGIALIDPLHIHHERAHAWFSSGRSDTWHTCPIVQNGVMRVIGHPKYPNSQPLAVVARSLASLLAQPGHVFVADTVNLMSAEDARLDRVLTSAQITDTYLLLLARSLGVRLATFDRRLVTSSVAGGDATVLHLP